MRRLIALLVILVGCLPAFAAERTATLNVNDPLFPFPLIRPVPVAVVNLPVDNNGNVKVVEQSTEPKQVEVLNFPPCQNQEFSRTVDLFDGTLVFNPGDSWESPWIDVSQFSQISAVAEGNIGSCFPQGRFGTEGNPVSVGGTFGGNLPGVGYAGAVQSPEFRVVCTNNYAVPVHLLDMKVFMRRN